ncbi:homeobox protein Hox-A3 [Platysternon megacephalum]|uniref:Homeobox protein Hox-A3 n=1 Tax=Platysternon megacephalum TaxID=55544 RepID=A0A4D9ED20_9SAUR|nr:homeobox protein Hox-A3 [Platysternon megacephalum]
MGKASIPHTDLSLWLYQMLPQVLTDIQSVPRGTEITAWLLTLLGRTSSSEGTLLLRREGKRSVEIRFTPENSCHTFTDPTTGTELLPLPGTI